MRNNRKMLTLYTLTSNLHSEAACEVKEEKFIRDIEERLGEKFDIRGERYECYGYTEQPHLCPDRGH